MFFPVIPCYRPPPRKTLRVLCWWFDAESLRLFFTSYRRKPLSLCASTKTKRSHIKRRVTWLYCGIMYQLLILWNIDIIVYRIAGGECSITLIRKERVTYRIIHTNNIGTVLCGDKITNNNTIFTNYKTIYFSNKTPRWKPSGRGVRKSYYQWSRRISGLPII